jgi:2-methylfumaryl-CoA hydratase
MLSRPVDGYFFEDYRLGQHFYHATPRTITPGDVALYIALTGARHPLSCAVTLAKQLGYRDMPVDNLLLFHIAFGKTVPDISYNAVANLGYADCRFLMPVFTGDTVRCESKVVGLKGNSNGKSGVVYVRSNAFNQRDENVLTWARWVMVHRRNAVKENEVAPIEGQTAFPPDIENSAIQAPVKMACDASMRAATGSNTMWDDIEATGKVLIRHPAGMTIEESDHMLATRLYQNSARVHFDAHHMKDSRFGKRLVYGGHVISLCYAHAYDGLENILSIAAIEGGTHTNPAFAGDTIYAVSHLMSKWAVNDCVGAVRIHLTGYKNASPNVVPNLTSAEQVLSLNYVVLMPRRTKGKP